MSYLESLLQGKFLIIFILSEFIVILALAAALLYLTIRLKKFMRGKEAKSLEKHISEIIEDNKRISSENEELKKLALDILKKDKLNLKSIFTVKFNPFSQSGHGKQSFASAILSEKGSGIILSTLSVRGETHVFLKEVENFKAGALTDEEAQALKGAMEKLTDTH